MATEPSGFGTADQRFATRLDDDGGRIEVSIGDFGDTVIRRVEEDGRGIGEQAPGRGLSIVEAVAEPLHGRLSVTGSGMGTSAVVSFPRNHTTRLVAPL